MTTPEKQRTVPQNTHELQAFLARSNDAGTKIDVAGGETLAGMGAPPSGQEVLATTALKKIVAYAAADLTVCVQAGVTLKSLASRLKRDGQFVPFDAPKPGRATVGGTLAAGWLGPRRHRYGRPRDLIVGSSIVLADGTLARAGGRVVKNVAGYDLSRLYVGSFGTLGVLVQANFKTLPLPSAARVFLAPLPDGTRARAFAQVRALAVEPSAALWIDGFEKEISGEAGAQGRLFILLEGSDELLERASRDLRSALGRAGVPQTEVIDARARDAFEAAVDAYIANVADRSITYRISGLPDSVESRSLAARDLVRRFALDADTIADAMNGDVIVRASRLETRDLALKFQVLDDAIHQAERRVSIVAGEHAIRPALAAWGSDPPALARMRALKASFDPHGILNAGRFIAGI
ncbi:MAG: FAD-binding oxidoreductase [Candidatus Tyrphobacter sp.]